VPSQAIQFSGLESEPPKPAPLLGQHTDEILTEVLGMSSGQISKLHDENIIAGPQ
jgi:2-methylfumaryl-CoA isomerase